jgi:hypothetical protein
MKPIPNSGSLIRFLSLLSLPLLLAGCVTNMFLPKELTMTAVELTTRLEKRFPVERTAGGLVDITFSKPMVTLAAPRMVTRLDVKGRLLMSETTTEGTLTLSGIPHYDPATRGLFLKDARVDRIELTRMSEALSIALSRVASQLVKNQFEDRPFHTFREEDFRKYGVGYEPLALTVREDAVVLTLKR